MKASIIRAVSADEGFVDADSGKLTRAEPFSPEPVRVLPRADPEPGGPSEAELRTVRNLLAWRDPDDIVSRLSRTLDLDSESTRALIERGGDAVIEAYIEHKAEPARALWKKGEEVRKRSCRHWLYRGKLVEVEGWEQGSRDEITTCVRHAVLQIESEQSRKKVEVERWLKPGDSAPSREPIPVDVRREVWRRDQGRCVCCGSQERLEFDHIIPVAKGGGNSFRNLQILCERCNRSKGASI